MQENFPKVFRVSISGLPGAAYAVELVDNYLRYDSSPTAFLQERPRKVRPTTASWENFWKEVEALRIWDWKSRYECTSNQPPASGVQIDWETTIRHGTKEVSSGGRNAFPPEPDGTSASGSDTEERETFERFNQAVCRLIGGLPFRP